ncbi:DUF3895 domain-containing protein [Neobacillus niacini]|uniref:DUF3895 domain-containing protein n=1 Tax=Neobacillus niacini TaxID=86668 RepID=UPI00203F6173|nr:DUF3895 domain-containing protein [Neobacillus niacini]
MKGIRDNFVIVGTVLVVFNLTVGTVLVVRNPETPCECGIPLRYQYIVRHRSTNQIRRFGITHFEEHTGLSVSLIVAIKKGFTQIDYERDELLNKIADGWSILDHVPNIPSDLKLAKDIQQHLDANVPLLERQLNRLIRDIRLYQEKDESNYVTNFKATKMNVSDVTVEKYENQESLDLFGETIKEVPKQIHIRKTGDSRFFQAINGYLDEGVTSVRVICELLIKHNGAEKERYLTGKPRIYPGVCQYLEQLVYDDKVSLIEVNGKEDRIYQIVGR